MIDGIESKTPSEQMLELMASVPPPDRFIQLAAIADDLDVPQSHVRDLAADIRDKFGWKIFISIDGRVRVKPSDWNDLNEYVSRMWDAAGGLGFDPPRRHGSLPAS